MLAALGVPAQGGVGRGVVGLGELEGGAEAGGVVVGAAGEAVAAEEHLGGEGIGLLFELVKGVLGEGGVVVAHVGLLVPRKDPVPGLVQLDEPLLAGRHGVVDVDLAFPQVEHAAHLAHGLDQDRSDAGRDVLAEGVERFGGVQVRRGDDLVDGHRDDVGCAAGPEGATGVLLDLAQRGQPECGHDRPPGARPPSPALRRKRRNWTYSASSARSSGVRSASALMGRPSTDCASVAAT